MVVPGSRGAIRVGISDMCDCTKQYGSDHRKSNCRHRECGNLDRKFCHSGACFTTSKPSDIHCCGGFNVSTLQCAFCLISATTTCLSFEKLRHPRFGVGATGGPLLGGVFTDLVTWRWCFYLNLPVGGVAIVAMILVFNPKKNDATDSTLLQKILQLDLIGNAILIIAAIMLFLPLQYTEEGESFRTPRVIGLLTASGVTFIIFGIWLWHRGPKALIPPHIIVQRSVAASCIIAFFIYGALLIHSYYLPIYFQAIKDDSAIRSGVNMIAYVLANAIFSLISGIFVSKVGFFAPPAMLGCAIGTVGCGLMTTLKVGTPSKVWLGYEILSSAGFGMAIQQGFTAVQTVLPMSDVPIGTAAVVACQSLGGAIFVSVGNTILQNELLGSAGRKSLQGVDMKAVADAGASGFRAIVPRNALPAVLIVYNGAIQKALLAAIPLVGLAFVGALALEWRSVKEKHVVVPAGENIGEQVGEQA